MLRPWTLVVLHAVISPVLADPHERAPDSCVLVFDLLNSLFFCFIINSCSWPLKVNKNYDLNIWDQSCKELTLCQHFNRLLLCSSLETQSCFTLSSQTLLWPTQFTLTLGVLFFLSVFLSLDFIQTTHMSLNAHNKMYSYVYGFAFSNPSIRYPDCF